MANDHYIPASLLGRFSTEDTGRARERKVWALKHGEQKAQYKKAEKYGSQQNFYDLLMTQYAQMPRVVDKTWLAYENHLGSVLETLRTNTDRYALDANSWLAVLIPFVASLFVRGPDFNERYEARAGIKEIYSSMAKKDPAYPGDNTNMARLMEFQRLLSPIMAASWTVLHTGGKLSLLTNERGYTLYKPTGTDQIGWLIPTGRDMALAIMPTAVNHGRAIITDTGIAKWKAILQHRTINDKDTAGFNRAIAGVASNFVIGPSEASVSNMAKDLQHKPLPAKYIYHNVPPSAVLRLHEHSWHYLLSEIKFSAIDKRLVADLQQSTGFILRGSTISFFLTDSGTPNPLQFTQRS
jgi:hypothetical protein